MISTTTLTRALSTSNNASGGGGGSPSRTVAQAARAAGLFRRTPLVYSAALSQRVQRDVYLKLDNLQASGSFKDRGMAHLCQQLSLSSGTTTTTTLQQQQQQQPLRVISSSGGNAGLAVATVAPRLGLHVSVVVPQSTKALVIHKLQALGANVTVHGDNWNAADALARQWVDEANNNNNNNNKGQQQQQPAAYYIPPYDNPLLWTGHSTVVDEILEELPHVAAICLSVGGGGLLLGVLEGLLRHGRHEQQQQQQQTSSSVSSVSSSSSSNAAVRVIAAETVGAACFHHALQAGRPVQLDGIHSIATSLGALQTTPVALEQTAAYRHYCSDNASVVQSLLCTDAQAVQACWGLATDHRFLVEPACGAALSAVYNTDLYQQYLQDLPSDGPIVVQVCGGSGVSIDLLQQWKQDLKL